MSCHLPVFFFNDTATTEIYTLSLHDALPISMVPGDTVTVFGWRARDGSNWGHSRNVTFAKTGKKLESGPPAGTGDGGRSEEHTSELQSLAYLVCRLLLEKKNYKYICSATEII